MDTPLKKKLRDMKAKKRLAEDIKDTYVVKLQAVANIIPGYEGEIKKLQDQIKNPENSAPMNKPIPNFVSKPVSKPATKNER